MELLYQRGSTQVFSRGNLWNRQITYSLYTVSAIDGRTRWMDTPARSEAEAIALADHYEEGRS